MPDNTPRVPNAAAGRGACVARLLFLAVIASSLCLSVPAVAAAQRLVPGPAMTGVLPGGALAMYCIPRQGWNGDLVIWAHGYTAVNQPLDFQELTAPDGSHVPDLVQSMGFAFATTSYRMNGLAVPAGVADIRLLAKAFPYVAGRSPAHTYIVGVSEGGLVATLLMEQSPELFSGALAIGAPVGSFKRQIDYVGDARVLFDWFFPGIIPGDPFNVPAQVMDNWDNQYAPAVSAAVNANSRAAMEFIRTAGATFDANDPSSVENTVLGLMWYGVFAANDNRQKLGGLAFGNQSRVYRGSNNDTALNQNVARFTAEPRALANLAAYETTGRPGRPIVLLHTTGDEIVPAWQAYFYVLKAWRNGNRNVTPLSVKRYGHVNFTKDEILLAFAALYYQVNAKRR